MSEQAKCNNELVIEGRFCSVTVCSKCNAFQLNIGPMSFRMEAEIFENLCEMILELCVGRAAFPSTTRENLRKH